MDASLGRKGKMVQIRQPVPNLQQKSSILIVTTFANEALNDSLVLSAGSRFQNKVVPVILWLA